MGLVSWGGGGGTFGVRRIFLDFPPDDALLTPRRGAKEEKVGAETALKGERVLWGRMLLLDCCFG